MHPHEDLARREIELIQAGDDEGISDFYASDLVLHYPGRSPLAGRYTDVGQFLDRLGELFEGGPSNVSSTTHSARTTTLCNCFALPRRLRGDRTRGTP